jgi:hypothetical protein
MSSTFPFPLSIAIWSHVLGGTLALICFSIPLVSHKGGKLHSRSGWIYTVAMSVVALSAFAITPWRMFGDPSRTENSREFAYFLFFIALFSVTSLQQGIFVFRFQKRTGAVHSLGALVLPTCLLLMSVVTLFRGAVLQNWLFLVFGVLAGSRALKQVRYWKEPPVHSKDWWFFHLENMFTCCIATVTAFVVTAVPRLMPSASTNSLWMWLAPNLALVPWMVWFIRKYELKFGLRK